MLRGRQRRQAATAGEHRGGGVEQLPQSRRECLNGPLQHSLWQGRHPAGSKEAGQQGGCNTSASQSIGATGAPAELTSRFQPRGAPWSGSTTARRGSRRKSGTTR